MKSFLKIMSYKLTNMKALTNGLSGGIIKIRRMRAQAHVEYTLNGRRRILILTGSTFVVLLITRKLVTNNCFHTTFLFFDLL